jgi:D-alanyl-D-alanine carboxypeptidase/D-alanyl-D-alanine-endopeptidase (penicillin-binding protein 4)
VTSTGSVLGRLWVRVALVMALATGFAIPADAGARKPAPKAQPKGSPGKKLRTGTKKAAKATPARKAPARATRGKRRTAARKPAPRAPAAAMVMVHGALRAPTRSLGRTASELTREEATAEAIEKILRGPLRFGTTGLHVVDAETGTELFSVHPDDPLNPASNVKLISTAAAIDLLGPDFRYTTRVLGPSPDADGVVPGDIYLLGSYDPTLGVDNVRELATQLAEAGIKRIAGGVVVGGTSTRDGIFRSRIRVDVTAGAPGEAPSVAVTPATDFVQVTTTAKTGKRARVKGKLGVTGTMVTSDDGHARFGVTVSGPIGKGKKITRWLSTRERHLHTAHVLRAAMSEAGITLGGDVAVDELDAYVDRSAATGRLPLTLAEHRSAPLARIISQVNKRSINWLSDRVIATASALTTDRTPSMARGVDAMYAWLDRATGIEREKLVVDTGSGLSYRTQFSPRQIVRVLRAGAGLAPPADADPDYVAACADAWRRSLSVAGIDGTLRHRFRSTSVKGRMVGKTGTLSNVIALSGLLEGPGGRTLAFSLVTNGHAPGRKHQIRNAHEQVVTVLDDYLRQVARAEAKSAAEAAAAAAAEAAATEAAAEAADAAEAAEAADGAEDDDLGDDDEGDDEAHNPPPELAPGDGGDGPVTTPAP